MAQSDDLFDHVVARKVALTPAPSDPAGCLAPLAQQGRLWLNRSASEGHGPASKLIGPWADPGTGDPPLPTLTSHQASPTADPSGLADKSATNLKPALAKSRIQPWNRQLPGLGISHWGKARAGTLAGAFPSAACLAQGAQLEPQRTTAWPGAGGEMIKTF